MHNGHRARNVAKTFQQWIKNSLMLTVLEGHVEKEHSEVENSNHFRETTGQQ
jgi:hypothetical protein